MKVEEIAEAIAKLSPEQLACFRRWFSAFEAGFAPTAPKSLVTSCPIDEETLISFHNECDGRGGVRLLLGAYADMPVISADFRKMRPLPDMHGNRTAVTTAHRQLCTWATPTRVKIKF